MPAFLAFMTAGMSGFSSRGGEEDEVDALGDHAVDVGDLLGGGAGGVGIDELAAALGGLVLHARGLREAPGIVALGLGEADLVGVLLLQRRHLAEGGHDGRGRRRRRPIRSARVCDVMSIAFPPRRDAHWRAS